MQRTDTEPNNVRINGMDTNNTYAQHIHRTYVGETVLSGETDLSGGIGLSRETSWPNRPKGIINKRIGRGYKALAVRSHLLFWHEYTEAEF